MKFLFWCSNFAIAYAYFGYPILLALLVKFKRKKIAPVENYSRPLVTIVVACHNEGSVIREKIRNSLELLNSYTAGSESRVIVASDGSTDNTVAEASAVVDPRVVVLTLPERQGKEAAQQAAVAQAVGEFIVFTDAKARLEGDALEKFAGYFLKPDVGGVSSVDRVVGEGSGEGFYVRYEMWMRRLESEFLSLVGMSGSAFAVRREVAEALRADVPSDFSLLLAIRERGLRGVLAEDIPCTYHSVSSAEQEFSRKVRTALRGILTVWKTREVLNPRRYGVFAWQVWSHKVMRWLVPWFLLVVYLSLAKIAPGSFLYSSLLLGACGLALAALLGFFKPALRQRTLVKIALFFFVSNVAIAVAWVKFLLGQQVVQWKPSERPALN